MLKNVLLACCATTFGLVTIEGAYRAYLYWSQPYHFRGDQGLWYLQSSPVTYNEAFGFDCVPGTYQGGYVYDGRVTECWDPVSWLVINERGNSGRIVGDYAEASLKVLAFGDSFTQRPIQGPDGDWMTWPNYLQDILEQELGESVHVVNFGRDGYGILQMFDLAAAKVAEWKPDLAIVAFITDDLDRARFWRTNTLRDGEKRVLVSSVPDPDPGWDVATDAFLIHSEATAEWCQEMLRTQRRDDPIVRELKDRVVEARRRSSLVASPWSLTQSFAFDVIVHGEPLHSTYSRTGPWQLPRHALQSFGDDSSMVAAVERLDESGVPYVLIHLASSGELEQGREFGGTGSISRQRMTLLRSLEELTGKQAHGTLDHADLSGKGSEELAAYFERDGHPSLLGHEFYAGVAASVLLSSGMLER